MLTFQKSRINKKLTIKVNEKTRELHTANTELLKLNSEIHEQNEKLVCNVEEISTQRDDLEDKNKTLLQLKRSLDIANENLSKANENLEIKVQERTDYLEKANTELDRFVYSASHDLSAPLKSMKGLLHLRKNDTKRNNHKYDKMISDSIGKLESVIQSMLQFSRNTSKIVVEEEIKLKEYISELINDLKYSNQQGNIIFDFVGLDKSKKIKVDAYRLSIILRNIISNSIKYIDLSKPENVISINYSENGGDIKISIKDNGIGIEKE